MSFTRDAIPALSVVDSPIEGRLVQAMFDKWLFTGYDQWSIGRIASSKLNLQFRIGESEDDSEYQIGIALQTSLTGIPKRRFDIVVSPILGEIFAVELDGFEFHSGRESFTRDRQNDRLAMMAGVQVFRFSGPEIYECPARVLDEIKEICDAMDSVEHRQFIRCREFADRRKRALQWQEEP